MQIAASGLGTLFWFSAAIKGKDCRNIEYEEGIKNMPHGLLHCKRKDISNRTSDNIWEFAPNRYLGISQEFSRYSKISFNYEV
jgi:hypothetical protein